MSSRRMALLGAPVGPWVYTTGILRPRVKVKGLEGSSLRVLLRSSAAVEHEIMLYADGTHDVPASPWMRMSCHPPVSTVCVEVLSGGSNAVSGT